MRGLAIVLGFLCGCVPPGDLYLGEPEAATCDASDDCSAGFVCVVGQCVIGTCDPAIEAACDDGTVTDRVLCCADREVCSFLSFTCVEDPDAPPLSCEPEDITCVQCDLQDDCFAGQFCSAGLCLEATGRESCTSSFQCPDGERCDREAFLCAPKRPCATCGPFTAHVCCFEGEVCVDDDGGGACIVAPPDPECTAATEDQDCGANRFCDAVGRCSECDAARPCSPGLLCNVDEGECFATGNCSVDADCPLGERCAPIAEVCVEPLCETTDDCGDDPRISCVEFRCELAEPVCVADLDEENDSAATATPIALDVPFAGALCRDDRDFLSFPVVPSTRYEATVEIENAGGVIITMLSTTVAIESTRTLMSSDSEGTVAGTTGDDESGAMFVQIQGTSPAADQWDYLVTVTASEM